MAAHSSSSKGRKNLDIQDKMKIIEDLKLGKSISDIHVYQKCFYPTLNLQ